MALNAENTTCHWERGLPGNRRAADTSRMPSRKNHSFEEFRGQLFLEAVGWVAIAAPAAVAYRCELIFAIAALVRLVTLRAEGGIACFFGGQCLVILLNVASDGDLPVMAMTSLLPPIIIALERKVTVFVRAFVIIVAFIPFVIAAYTNNAGMTAVLEDRLLLLIAHVFGFSFLLAYLLRNRLALKRLNLAVLICGTGAAVYFFSVGDGLFSRVGVGAACHEIGRNAGICSLVFLIGSILAATPLQRLAFGLISVCALGIAAAPLSRQGLYMVPLSFMFLMYASKHLRTNVWKSTLDNLLLVSVSIALLAVVGVDVASWLKQPEVARLGELADDSRIERLQFAWEMFLSRPITGHGFGRFDDLSGLGYPHNLFAEVMCEFGILGMLILFVPGMITLRQSFYGRMSADGNETIVIKGILVFWFLVSGVSYSLNHSVICFSFLPWLFWPSRRLPAALREPQTGFQRSLINIPQKSIGS